MEAKNPFDYQKPTEESTAKIIEIREACKNLHTALLTVEHSRERSVAITKLEEVSMWINKAIVFSQKDAVQG